MGERSEVRGRRRYGRLAGLMAFGLVVATLSYAVWRSTSLSGLPDIGDPFDVASFGTIEIPEDENAWTYYRKANARLTPEPDAPAAGTPNRETDPVIVRWMDGNKASLDLWIEGSMRTRGVYIQPKDMSFDTLLPDVQKIRTLARLGLCVGSVREAQGDMAGAWEVYKAGLRSGRHCGAAGIIIQRLVGMAIYSMYAGRVSNWASDPRLDAATLRAVLAEVEAVEAMKPKMSDTLKVEYLVLMRALRADPERYLDPAGLQSKESIGGASAVRAVHRLSRAFTREPERSRRVVRLTFANWLASCDLPKAERKGREVRFDNLVLFRPGPEADPRSNPLSVEEIARWSESSLFVKLLLPQGFPVLKAIDREESTRANLLVHLAEEIALRETGKFPESLESLVGPYLKELPQGYVPIVGPPDGLAPKRPK